MFHKRTGQFYRLGKEKCRETEIVRYVGRIVQLLYKKYGRGFVNLGWN